MRIAYYCANFPEGLLKAPDEAPWEVLTELGAKLLQLIESLGDEYVIRPEGVAIHQTAKVHSSAEIQAPAIIGPDCFVGPHSLLRGGVYMGASATIGFACEVKSTIICADAAIAHLNYVGDSIVGSGVDLEAGAHVVNYYNERQEKEIIVVQEGERVSTGTDKFGALIGDGTKIGANAVLAPGTVLDTKSVVKRLELVDQSLAD